MAVLQVGAGGVGWVLAHKLAQNNDVFGDIVLASRTAAKADRIVESIHRKNCLRVRDRTITTREVNADDVASLCRLIHEAKPKLVVNAGPPWVNVAVMEACCR